MRKSVISIALKRIANTRLQRVFGFDGQTVIGNTSIQGEYAELSVDAMISNWEMTQRHILYCAYAV